MITLNSDLGESIGLHSFGNDPKLLGIIDAANIACGFHAGDPDAMQATVDAGVENGVALGAHPGLPDIVGFGRRAMAVTPEELRNLLLYQVGALTAFIHRAGGTLAHIKPHGAMYGMVARDPELMQAVADVADFYGAAIYGLAGTAHQEIAAQRGIPFVPELYVDLDYNPDGSLRISRKPHLTDPEAAAARVVRAAQTGAVTAIDGSEVPVEFGSVCVHSDTANSAEVAAAVAAALRGANTLEKHQ